MPLPILTVAQMREWERATWAAGQTENFVIEQVGAAIAARLMQLTKAADRILLLAGKGHNGDDVRAAIPALTDRKISLLDVRDPNASLPELTKLLRETHPFRYVVDGLFGIGLSRPLDASWQAFIAALNAADIPIVSIDVPSGLNADSGQPEGAAIRAALTLTVGAPKSGLLLLVALPFIGRLEVLTNVGLIPLTQQTESNWISAEDFQQFPPARAVNTHKGSFGHAVLIAGSSGYHGAAVLAAKGALRAQPGLVSVITQDAAYVPVASQVHAAMVHAWRFSQRFPDNTTALLYGPGLAGSDVEEELKKELRRSWTESPLPMVVDASALDWLPHETNVNAIRVITPHPGEAARLLQTSSASVQSNRLGSLRELSRRFGNCWVVLKGHQTLIGRSAGNVFVNSSGNPFLAQGGSGDVLAGLLTGLLAQPGFSNAPEKIICYGVWRHGHAADLLTATKGVWTSEDLANTV